LVSWRWFWGGDELRALRTRRKSGGRCTRGDVGVGGPTRCKCGNATILRTPYVMPFERLWKRKNAQPTDHIFGKVQRDLFNIILDELKLKFDPA